MDQVGNNQSVSWLPLEVEQANLAPGSIDIHVGPATIEIKQGFDPHLLRQIVKVLKSI